MGDTATRLTREQRRLASLLLRQRGLDPAQLPIPRRANAAAAPLSTTQQRLWTSGRIAEGTSYGNVPMAFRLHGPLNVDWLSRALSLVVARHEILRTTYIIEDGRAVQQIRDAAPLSVAVEDLRTLSSPNRGERFELRVLEEARRPFDLGTDTLLRATAIQLADEEWGLVMVSHHIATDGWGARLLLDELSIAYRALAEQREPELPALAIQYADYAEWELERLASGELDAQRSYWVERLSGAPRQLALPFDFPPSDSVATERKKIALSPELSDQLRQLSRSRGVTPYVTLLAALDVLLQRSTGQNDIVVGTILSRRTRSETEPLIGNFGNNLLLRTSFDGDPALAEVIDRTAAAMRDALAHSDVPLEAVAQVAPIPAFHVMFILRDGSYEERLALPGLSAEPVRAASGAATLDLILDITDGSRGIEGYVEYRSARFTPDTIQRLADGLQDVVGRLVREPHLHLSALPRLEIGPSRVAEDQRAAGEEPVTRTEQMLGRLWREWLEIKHVYRRDNFFQLGGDSLRAVYVLEQAEQQLGYRFKPEDLSRLTLQGLAALCDGGTPNAVSASESVSPLDVRRVNPLELADQIKALFEQEHLPHLVEFFDRAYPAGVNEGMSSWIAMDETKRVVGHIAMFPQRFVCNGSEYTGAIGANLVMDTRYRNLANAVALIRALVSDAERDGGVDFLFGDPNEHGRAIMSSVGGFTEIGVLTRFVLPLGQGGVLDPAVAAYVGLKLKRGRREPMEVERRPAAAFDVREIEYPPGTGNALRPVHTPEIFRRRLHGYPTEGDAWYLFTRDSERMAAVLVRRFRRGDRAELCCIWRRSEVSLAQLLHPLVSDLRAAGVKRLQAFTLMPSALGRELRSVGFLRREKGGRFIAMPCSARGRALLERRVGWEITNLDSDGGVDWAITDLQGGGGIVRR